jgi:hypothetical protein
MELLGLVKTEMVIRSERRMLLVFVLMLGWWVLWGFGEGGRWRNGLFEFLKCEREEEGSRLGHQRHFHDLARFLLAILVKLSCKVVTLHVFSFQPHKYHPSTPLFTKP